MWWLLNVTGDAADVGYKVV